MSNLIHRTSPNTPSSAPLLDRAVTRGLARLERQTLMEVAHVQSSAIVQNEMLREIDRLARTAMSGQALLLRWRDTLAAGDPLVAEDLKFFSDIARLAKGEVLADTVDWFRRSY